MTSGRKSVKEKRNKMRKAASRAEQDRAREFPSRKKRCKGKRESTKKENNNADDHAEIISPSFLASLSRASRRSVAHPSPHLLRSPILLFLFVVNSFLALNLNAFFRSLQLRFCLPSVFYLPRTSLRRGERRGGKVVASHGSRIYAMTNCRAVLALPRRGSEGNWK